MRAFMVYVRPIVEYNSIPAGKKITLVMNL